MAYPYLLTDITNGVLTVTFNQPKKLNVLSPQTMVEITKILNEAATNDTVDIVVLTGAGNYYSSGADLNPDNSLNLDDTIKLGREFVGSFIDFPKLLIAIVNGPAVGIAVTTLALCDLVYCSTESTFVVPFCFHGLSAEGCSSYLFPQIMGMARANEVLHFGKKFNATEAKEWGFVTEIYKPDDLTSILLPKIHKMRKELVMASVQTNKKLMRKCNSKILHEVNAAEWNELKTRLTSPEFFDAVLKFSQRKNSKKSNL